MSEAGPRRPRALGALLALALTAAPLALAAPAARAATATADPDEPSQGRPYRPSGTRVKNSLDSATAPLLATGRYLDDVPAAAVVYYALDLPEGVTPRISAVLSRTSLGVGEQVDDQLEVELLKGEDRCTSDSDSQQRGGQYGFVPVVAYLETREIGGTGTGCGSPGRYLFSVQRTSKNAGQGPATTAHSNDPLPVELQIVLEPKVLTVSNLPAPVKQEASDVPALPVGSPVRPVTSGSGFSNAPLIGPGTYSDKLSATSVGYYRVKAAFGQRIRYTIRFHPVPDRPRTGTDYSASVSTGLYSPVREPMGDQDSGNNSESYPTREDAANTLQDTVIRNLTHPVSYRNREDNLASNLAGEYLLEVRTKFGRGLAGAPIPFTLTLALEGAPTGAPAYQPIPGASSMAAFGAGTTPVAAAGAAPTAASSAVPGADPVGAEPAAASPAGGSGANGLLGSTSPLVVALLVALLLVGLAVLVGLVLVARMLRRLQRTPGPAAPTGTTAPTGPTGPDAPTGARTVPFGAAPVLPEPASPEAARPPLPGPVPPPARGFPIGEPPPLPQGSPTPPGAPPPLPFESDRPGPAAPVPPVVPPAPRI